MRAAGGYQFPASQSRGARAQHVIPNTEAPQHRIRAGGKAVAARFGARKRITLQEENIVTGTGQEKRGRGPGGAAAYDDYVSAVHTRVTVLIRVTCFAR